MVVGGVRRAGTRLVLAGSLGLLAGCLQEQALGPDLGACAVRPEGAFTFGEAGIGTCIAGPVDLRFVELDGETRLLVSNADPYQNYASGSLLVIDWDQLDLDSAPSRLGMDTVPARATTLGEDRYFGQIGLILDRDDGTPLALLPSRFSGDSTSIDVDDPVHVVDLSDPSAPGPWAEGPELYLGADPMHVAVTDGRAYVSYLSEDYLAVIDTHATPMVAATLSGGARISVPEFTDVNARGARASLSDSVIFDASLLLREDWTLTWADATWRIWLPEAGLTRWDVGGGIIIPSPTGPDIDASLFDDPITSASVVIGDSGTADLWIASGGSFYLAQNAGAADEWAVDTTNLSGLPRGRTTNTPEALDAPSVFVYDDVARVAFDARLDGEPASIGIGSQLADATAWSVDTTQALVPPAGASYEDPVVRIDPFWGTPRMWLSQRAADGTWTVLESVSADGVSWSEPVATDLPAGTSSPVVNWFNGSYLGWFSVWDDSAGWTLARARSVDGITWEELELLEPLPGGDDPLAPPGAAVLTSILGGFRVQGADSGRFDGLAVDGDLYDQTVSTRGFAFEVSTGFVAEGEDVDEDLGLGGVSPGAILTHSDRSELVVELLDGAGRSALYRIEIDGDGLLFDTTAPILPLDDSGLVDASDPVVFGEEGAWVLLFAETDDTLGTRIRRATSADGETWSLDAEPVLSSIEVDFADAGLLPGSVQELADGSVRLWFTGIAGSTNRIGSAVSSDAGQSFTVEPSAFTQGALGDFDDSGARDPYVFELGDEVWLAYSGSDGSQWQLGLARIEEDEALGVVRRLDLAGEVSPWLPLLARTFAAGGAEDPLVQVEDGGLRVWFAGNGDSEADPQRIGMAVGSPQVLYPDLRIPSRGDQLTFTTINEGGDAGQLVLTQTLDGFATSAVGLSGMRVDPERGMLYVTSDTSNGILAVDVDRAIGRADSNVDDIEAVLRVRANTNTGGFRDVIAPAGSELLYASSRLPDAVAVLDGSRLEDDSEKQAYDDVLLGVLSMRTSGQDVGVAGDSRLAGGVIALREADGRRHLFVPHFRDNSVSVFDLDRGDYGELVGYVPFVGENPHVARLSPDGRYVAVANYLGDVEDGFVSSTVTIIDADPASDTFLDVVTTLVNR